MFRKVSLAGILALGLLSAGLAGCEEKKVTTETEVEDKLLGGKEIKQKEVIEQGDKVQVREKETDIDSDGDVEEKKVKVQGDKID